jgi:hypothetical protein
MVMTTSILLKKEIKQNTVIFVVPYLFLLLIIILNRQNTAWLPPQWIEPLAISLPLAMAGAYGLQAFDLEENGRTKDFLITKPLSPGQIVGTKYLCGLLVLLPLTVLWLAVLLPQSLTAPNLINLGSFWLTLFLLVTVIGYSASFLAGILLKGPVKLLAGVGLGVAAISWTGLVWCAGLTALYYAAWDRFPGLALTLIYLLTLSLLGFLVYLFVSLVLQILKNTATWQNIRKTAGFTFAVLVMFPLLLWLSNIYNRPAIGAFDNLARSFLTTDDWFIGLEGARQPAGQLTALTDARGRLGIAGPFQKPRIVYVSTGIATTPLQNITWSPDGRMITFSDNGHIKLYSLTTKATKDLGEGIVAFWSRDSRQIMIGREITGRKAPRATPTANFRRISLKTLDLQHSAGVGAVEELYTDDLALDWDSSTNTLFAVNRRGILTIINLGTGQAQKIALLPANQKEPVFFGKIAPPDSQSSIFTFILCNFDSTQAKQRQAYTLRWYDLDQKTKKITLTGTLTRCPYKDIIVCNREHALLVRRYNNGMYQRKKL